MPLPMSVDFSRIALHFFLLSILIITHFYTIVYSTKFMSWTRDSSFDNLVVIDFTRDLYDVGDSESCGQQCVTWSSCTSFFHNPLSQRCVLSPVHFTVPALGLRGAGFRYYRLRKGTCPVTSGYLSSRNETLCYQVHKLIKGLWSNASHLCQQEESTLVRVNTENKLREVQRTLQHNYVCPDSQWAQFRNSCYYFYPNIFAEYSVMNTYCGSIGAYGVGIETQEENDFLQKFIIDHYPNVKTWRTGGLLSVKMWDGNPKTPFNFTNWLPGYTQQTYYPTLLLQWHNQTKSYKWIGSWFGNAYQSPSMAFPFICERNAYLAHAQMKYAIADTAGGCQALDGQRLFLASNTSCATVLQGFVCEKDTFYKCRTLKNQAYLDMRKNL